MAFQRSNFQIGLETDGANLRDLSPAWRRPRESNFDFNMAHGNFNLTLNLTKNLEDIDQDLASVTDKEDNSPGEAKNHNSKNETS